MNLETAMRNAIADAYDVRVNTGAGTAQLKFETSADAAVAAVNLQNPAFGAAAAGVITLAGVPLTSGAASAGTIEHASIYDRDAAKLAELTCGTAGAEIIITSLVIAATETIDLTSLTITCPAS